MDPWRTIAQLSAVESRQLQNHKLNLFINQQIYPFSPHYRKVFDAHKLDPHRIQTVDDLKHLPFTSKTDFLVTDQNPEKAKEFILQPDAQKIKIYWPLNKKIPLALKKIFKGSESIQDELGQEYRPVFMTFTTGTTNAPIAYLYSGHDLQNLYVSGARMLKLFNIKDSDRIANVFPFAPHLAFWQVVFAGFASSVLILSTGGGKVTSTEGNITAILKMKPAVVVGVPSYVYHLLRAAREKGCRMDFVQKVVLGAAAVTEPFKVKLRSLLAEMGAPDVFIFGTYGFTEARTAWAECPTKAGISSGYHLYPDKEIFEIVDPDTGEVKKEGEDGELVYTSIDSRASVVLRYRTGDFVKGGITWEPCPYCHMRGPRLSSDISRISDIHGLQLSKIKGSLVNMSDFSTILNDFPQIVEWQIEIRKKDNDPHEVDEVTIYICEKPGANQKQLEEDIKKKIQLATEVCPNQIVFTPLPDLVKRLELETASKEKRILDNRPKN